MRLHGPGKRLTIYCGEGDSYGHHSLAQAIVERARDAGLAGATLVRGVEGFGASSHLHTSRILSLSDDLPIVIQIVDDEEHIAAFVPIVAAMMEGGLVTLEDVDVHVYRAGSGDTGAGSAPPSAPP